MFTERKMKALKNLISLYDKVLSLFHQTQPNVLRFIQSNWKFVHALKHFVAYLLTQFSERFVRIFSIELLLYCLGPPVTLLRRYIGRTYNPNTWVHKKESEDLSMSGLCRIGEREWCDTVLEDIGER